MKENKPSPEFHLPEFQEKYLKEVYHTNPSVAMELLRLNIENKNKAKIIN